MAKSATRTSIANSTPPFHEIRRSYLLASQVQLHLRVFVRWKIEHDTRKIRAPGPAFDEISISLCSLRHNGSLRPGARLKARHRRILDGDHEEFHTEHQPIAHYRKPHEIGNRTIDKQRFEVLGINGGNRLPNPIAESADSS